MNMIISEKDYFDTLDIAFNKGKTYGEGNFKFKMKFESWKKGLKEKYFKKQDRKGVYL